MARVRVVPFFRDQKVIGYRFLSIKPGSLMETMGYEKGGSFYFS